MENIRLFKEKGADMGLVSLAENTLEIPALPYPDTLPEGLFVKVGSYGITLEEGGRALRGDFVRLHSRTYPNRLNSESLIKACRVRNIQNPTAVDATAGLGEDAFLLAAYGFNVTLFEQDPVIFLLLYDALKRGLAVPFLKDIISRMELFNKDSIKALPHLNFSPDVVFLDPMFPERKKSGLIKKKFQLLHFLEKPCENEQELLSAALCCSPSKIVVKRPLKAPFLGNMKPSFQIKGSTIRYDCLIPRP